MSPCFVVFVLSSLQLVRVASYSLTMTPEYLRTSPDPESVSFSCTADTVLTRCQFRWRDHRGNAGPLLDLSRGSLSQVNSTHLDTEVTGYSYSGRGLDAGDCGVSLQVEGYKIWMVACRVRAETEGWTYAWSDLYAFDMVKTSHTRTPREAVVLLGGEARFTTKARESLKFCNFYPPGSSYDFHLGAESYDSAGRHRYVGGGVGDGECGLALTNVSEADNGPVRSYIENTAGDKADFRFTALIVARRPTAPVLTVVQGNNGIDATCVVKNSRPIPQMTWLLGDDVIRQDSVEDTLTSPQDEWRWPWMQGSLTQRVALKLKPGDDGKSLKCRVTHVTLNRPLEVDERLLIKNTAPSCPLLTSNTTSIACFSGGQVVNCTRPLPLGSWAEVVCKPGYTASKSVTYSRINCTDSGEWDSPVFACHPDCGRRNKKHSWPRIAGGETAMAGEFPWHVAIYEKVTDSYTQICGGSLVSTRIVLTAAHCFWSEQLNRQKDSVYEVAAGKHKRVWLDPEDDDQVQRRRVELVTIPSEYHGRHSSFQSDIALLRLSALVDITANVNLVCVDWGHLWEQSQLQRANNGTVPGLGYTEQGRQSSALKHVDLPYIDHDTCFNALDDQLKPMLTIDKFCAGHAHRGVSTCPGDSGGGLVFLRRSSGRYYLRGLSSIAFKPASSTALCYAESYTAFTRVSNYHQWMMDHGV